MEHISSILNSISGSKTRGLDELTARGIKDGYSVIAKCVVHNVNLYISTGIIPNDVLWWLGLFHCITK